MTKKDKLIQKAKRGTKFTPQETQRLLKNLGLEEKEVSGSHQTWSDSKYFRITILLNKKETPEYIMDEIRQIIKLKNI